MPVVSRSPRPGGPPAPAPGSAAADPRRRVSPERQRLGAAAASVDDQLRQHRDGYDEREADLAQRGRHRPEQPLGVGQRVGRAHADDDRAEPSPSYSPAQQDSRSPARAGAARAPSRAAARSGRSSRQEDAVARHREQDPEQYPVTTITTAMTTRAGTSPPEGCSERRAITTRVATAPDGQQHERVGRERRCGRKPERPHPPGDRMQVAGQPGAHRAIIPDHPKGLRLVDARAVVGAVLRGRLDPDQGPAEPRPGRRPAAPAWR